ncbi:hypothetical protein [Microtetraspora malaysiensis]|uniref:hypothetical protein n=1 Tax=Microtetraspora malaysiensis TaxID=161358 RepID=UPI003D8D7DA7
MQNAPNDPTGSKAQHTLPFPYPTERRSVPRTEFSDPLEGPIRYTLTPSPTEDLLLMGDGRSIIGIYRNAGQCSGLSGRG